MMKPLHLLSIAAAVLMLCGVPAQAQKTSALPEATSADSADILRFVDVSDTTLAATGTDKRITIGNLSLSLAFNASALTTGTVPTARLASPLQVVANNSGTLDLSGVTLTLPPGTGGTPAGSGTELQYRNGANFGAIPGSSWNGTLLSVPNVNTSGDSLMGRIFTNNIKDNGGGNNEINIATGRVFMNSTNEWTLCEGTVLGFSPSRSTSPDVILRRDAPNTLTMRNGENMQSLEIHTYYTDISNRRGLSIQGNADDLGNPGISAWGAGTGGNADLFLSATSNIIRFNGSITFHADSTFGIGGASAGTDTNRPLFINVGSQGVISLGDLEVTDTNKGVILKSPSGNRYRLKVDDDGLLSTEQIF